MLRVGSLYKIPLSMHEMANEVYQMTQSISLEGWNRHLGHLNVKSTKAVESIMLDMQIKDGPSNLGVCKECIEGTFSRTRFPSKGGQRASKRLE